jgi:two-component system, OmpR family, alkaline phosphatase synthesis response regulator PhoP
MDAQRQKKILIVDDEPKIVEICRDYLAAAGYAVIQAGDGPQGLTAAREETPDLIVLDLMLPGMNGLDVCRTLRRESHVPIIMLTARVEEADKLRGLELGADDYLTKPFSPRELVARVGVVLRRASEPQPLEILNAGEVTLDRARYVADLVTEDGTSAEIQLTPTEFDILYTLASQPGRIFSRSQLLMAARGISFESYERAIDSHIRNLRKKLNTDGGKEYIVTVHGVGYKFGI